MADIHDSDPLQDEISRLREEHRHLRARQDELDRLLHEQKKPRSDREPRKDDDEAHDHEEKEPEEKKAKPKLSARVREAIHAHPLRSGVIGVAAVLVLVGGALFYLHSRTYEDTDDAQIDADISAVSPRIEGTVVGVNVVDNQRVHAGDILAELDPHDYELALTQARAGLAQAEAQLGTEAPQVPITTVQNRTTISTSDQDVASAAAELATSESTFQQARAQLAQAEANDRFAQVERLRDAKLVAVGAVAPSQADERSSAADATRAIVESMRQGVIAAQKRIDEQRAKLEAARTRLSEARTNAPQQLEAREAAVALRKAAVVAARAALEQAELNRSYVRIVAPVDGIIGKKSLNIGDRVQPGQQVVAITQTDRLWVTANFRETQIRKMHPGQRAAVHVDALDLDLGGAVESIAGATGSRFSLLPPENATGNYVKVVQRLPLRIRLDPGQAGWERLRPGMSVEPTVTLK